MSDEPSTLPESGQPETTPEVGESQPIVPQSVPVYCWACGGDTHVERIGVQDYYVCDDVDCMWMQPIHP